MNRPSLAAIAHVPHGGNLNEAIRRYGIAREHWCDLSTGINPHGYPIPAIDADAWLRLPEDDDDLEAVAAHYYGARRTVAVAGTQAAIRMLPQWLEPGAVAIHALTYGEYAPAFEQAGFPVERFVDASLPDESGPRLQDGESLPDHWRYLVVVNPNNPTAHRFELATLRRWQRELSARGGALIVDEAFGDATPDESLAPYAHEPGAIVLRSVGKFFGLAGARVGFVIAPPGMLDLAARLRGPWTIAGPARAVVRSALLDTPWHAATRTLLAQESERLEQLLASNGLCASRTPLFAWARTAEAQALQERLAKTGVWVRRFDRIPCLRFGLPASESGWKTLSDGLRAALG
ncbi:Threonine-phosphate decarboxylase [Pararobbsia alpina]|uniref:threonine-phosphate decarboxylase CobD n=1 Tax=Pararobbsia alpina TaxID=621374 RepID=UPI0039A70803